MRFAAIADVHGNCMALEAVLADIDRSGISDVVNLGDNFSGPLEAGRTADLLLSRDFVSVMGNHDRHLLEHRAEEMHSWEADAFGQLEARHLDWLRSLPFSRLWREEVYLCHATPMNDNLYWLEGVARDGVVHLRPLAEIEAIAGGIAQPLILCGHSHVPRAVRLPDGRLIVNPGSVGCPAYDDVTPCYHRIETGTPHASYAVLEKADARWRVEFRLVPYDHLAMSRLARKKGRQDWAGALAAGWL